MPGMEASAPLGVFDSGVGGLSVLAHLQRVMPHEDVLYLGDTAHVPYGGRSETEVITLTERALRALQARGVKAAVVACNTAAAFSLSRVRATFPFPVIGLVPAVKPAALASRTGHIAVLATPVTLKGQLLEDVIRDHATPRHVHVTRVSNLDLVPLVEAGLADSPQARAALRETLGPLRDRGVDQLVLGCTHYPFLARSIHAEFGNAFTLVDSGDGVARHTRTVLEREGLLNPQARAGQVTFLVTGDVHAARTVMTALAHGTPQPERVHNGGQSNRADAGSRADPLRIEHIQT